MRAQDDSWGIESSVGITALGVAAARAAETAHPDRLIEDPFAALLVDAVPTPPAFSGEEFDGAMEVMRDFLAVRTKFFDEAFADAAVDDIPQAVILASGLDSRPYRTTMPPRTFEIDQPAVIDFKNTTLRAAGANALGEHTTIGVDLRHDWGSALLEAGFADDRPSAFLAEGLLPYLPVSAQRSLFEVIDRVAAPGSRVFVEAFDEIPETVRDAGAWSDEVENRLGIDFDDLVFDDAPLDVPAYLDSLGWSVTTETVGDAARRYGRELDPAVPLGGVYYVSATKG